MTTFARNLKRNDRIKLGRTTWRVQQIVLVAVFSRSGDKNPRLRFLLADGRGHHRKVTLEQTDVVQKVTS